MIDHNGQFPSEILDGARQSFCDVVANSGSSYIAWTLAKPEYNLIHDLVCLGPSDVVDDVQICQGGVLILDGTCVTGNIKIKQGGALKAFLANIEGDVKADRAFLVELTFSRVGGCVELKQTGGSGTVLGEPPSIYLLANTFVGNVKIEKSNVFSLNVSYNQICRKLELKYNVSCLPIVCEFNGGNPPPPPPPPPPG